MQAKQRRHAALGHVDTTAGETRHRETQRDYRFTQVAAGAFLKSDRSEDRGLHHPEKSDVITLINDDRLCTITTFKGGNEYVTHALDYMSTGEHMVLGNSETSAGCACSCAVSLRRASAPFWMSVINIDPDAAA